MQCQVVESNAQWIEHLNMNSWQFFNKLSTAPTLLSCLLLMMTRLLISCLHLSFTGLASSTVDVVFPRQASWISRALTNSYRLTTLQCQWRCHLVWCLIWCTGMAPWRCGSYPAKYPQLGRRLLWLHHAHIFLPSNTYWMKLIPLKYRVGQINSDTFKSPYLQQ